MPPRIIPILDRLRQDIAAGLATETIEQACRQCNRFPASTSVSWTTSDGSNRAAMRAVDPPGDAAPQPFPVPFQEPADGRAIAQPGPFEQPSVPPS